MNYRHLFHAGNFADVHKHVVLIALLHHLLKKPKLIFFLDTHAGRGDYDLVGSDAARSNEWQSGIGRLWQAQVIAPEILAYLRFVREFQPLSAGESICRYPGSPAIAARILRNDDRRVFIEKHPEEASALRSALRSERNTSIEENDGYRALRAHLPPKENRGLVLIDPPYEAADELKQLQKALLSAIERWPTGVYCVWYPLKSGDMSQSLHAGLQASGLRKLLISEIWVRPLDAPVGLNGSGLLIVNPPWQLDLRLREISAELLKLLAPEDRGGMRVEWLAGE